MKIFNPALFLLFLLTITQQSCAQNNRIVSSIVETKLQVTVRDDRGNLVDSAEVIIYDTEEDFSASRNQLLPAKFTDNKGRTEFEGLEEKAYFISVEKGDANNYGLGVRVEPLKANRKNKSTVIISDGL